MIVHNEIVSIGTSVSLFILLLHLGVHVMLLQAVYALLVWSMNYGPAKLRDSIRFRIVRPIRDSIRIDGPIRNFRIVRAVNRHS